MLQFLFFVSVFVSAALLIFMGWLLYSKGKISKKNLELLDKLTAVESHYLSPVRFSQEQKQKARLKEAPAGASVQANVLEVKKELAKYRDEAKKLREELRSKDKELLFEKENVSTALYPLKEENSRLLEQLKEMDAQVRSLLQAQKTQISAAEHDAKSKEVQRVKNEVVQLKSKLVEFEKLNKNHVAKISSLQNKLQSTEVDARWRDRALTGRKMYQLMRQMRELSDSKIETYQDGVLAVTEWVFAQKNMPLPEVRAGENKADRMLSEAWHAIAPEEPISMDQSQKIILKSSSQLSAFGPT